MRVAFLSDVHGNLLALEAVLADVERERVDRVVCGGDVVDPLWTSRAAVERLERAGIPVLRGNHEDYMWRFHFGDDGFAEELRTTVKYWPVASVARKLGREFSARLRELPIDLTIEARPGRPESRAHFCHGTPLANNRVPIAGIDDDLAGAYDATEAALVVCGHWHLPWSFARALPSGGAQQLVAAGSAGLSLRGSMGAEYLILTYRDDARLRGWTVEPRVVPYDRESICREYRESGALAEGGPIAWCLYDEFESGRPRLGPALEWLRANGRDPKSLEDWIRDVRAYLESVGRWEAVRARV